MLLFDDLSVVFRLKEVPLTSRLNESLPLIIFALHLARASLDQYVYWYHHRLISHQPHREICEPRHYPVSGHCPQTLTQYCVITVRLDCPDRIHWIQIFDSQLCVMFCRRILAELPLNVRSDILQKNPCYHEYSFTYYRLDIARLILNHVFLPDAHLVIHNGFLGFNEPVDCSLGNNDHAVTFHLATLDDRLIDTMLALQLEVHLWDQADVHVTACQGGGYCNKTAVSSHQFDNPHPILSSFRLNICRVNERYSSLACSVKPERSINKWNVIIDGLRYPTYAHLNILLSQLLLKS